MHAHVTQAHRAIRTRLSVTLAHDETEVREAQRLRYRVFGEELGARLPSAAERLDRDLFDPWCHHVLVREEHGGEVVGTCRILTPTTARRIGGLYSDNEFDLTRLLHLRPRMAEVGRSCVHPDWRTGSTIGLLWQGIASFMKQQGHDYLVGCASMSMADGGHLAASVYQRLAARHLSPIEWRVRPRCPLPLAALDTRRAGEAPALIRAYLRLGAYIGGEPAWDPDFNCADLFILLPLARMNPRHARHFFGHGRR